MKMNVNELIATTIRTLLPGSKVILFGSRSKGTATAVSDFDLLIIPQNNILPEEKVSIKSKIRKALALQSINSDLLLQNPDDILAKARLTGHIVKQALKEGIEL
jgi:predicted nucleotidyltransferase